MIGHDDVADDVVVAAVDGQPPLAAESSHVTEAIGAGAAPQHDGNLTADHNDVLEGVRAGANRLQRPGSAD